MKFIPYTQEGTRDRLFSECRERRQVQSQLTHLFSRRGYAEIITPEVEFYDSFVTGGCAIPQESEREIVYPSASGVGSAVPSTLIKVMRKISPSRSSESPSASAVFPLWPRSDRYQGKCKYLRFRRFQPLPV